MQKKKIAAMSAALIMSTALAISGTMAYLTDSEQATNTFTIGDVTVDLEEPNYPGNDSNDVKDLVPNEEVPKDPQVENTGVNDAIVFIKMTVPVANVTAVGDDGTVGTKQRQEIFYFKDSADAASAHANHFDSSWIELTTKEEGTDYAGATRTYVFGYNTAIAKDAKTNPLFDKVQLKNFIEGEIGAGAAQDIKIETYAIQGSDILGSAGTDLTGTLNAASLTEIYNIFINQGTSASPAAANTNNNKDLSGADISD